MKINILLFFLLASMSGQTFAGEVAIIPEVNLRAMQNSIKKDDVYVSTTHIERKEIENSPVINLSALLKQNQSIVRLTNNSGDSSQTALSIRGFGDNAAANSLILVDGFPLTNPSLLAPNFNAIALVDIERIDIIEGSEGIVWGDQAVGGVVNIVTKHPEKWLFNSNVGLGSFSHVQASSWLGNKFSNGLFFKTIGFAGESDNYRDHNRQTIKNFVAQIGSDYARGTLSFKFQYDNNTINFPGGLSEAQFNTDPRLATNFKNFAYYQTRTYQLLSKHELNYGWLLETRLSRHSIDGNGFVFVPYDRAEWVNSLHPRLIGNLYNNKIITGIYFENSSFVLSNIKVQQTASAQQKNIYAEIIVPIFKTLEITMGARYAWQNNETQQNLAPSINSINRVLVSEAGISYKPTTAWQFFLRKNGNFRFPKANENGWTPINVNGLQVQTGESYETGVTWLSGNAKTQLNLYRLQLKNEIAFDPTQTAELPFGSFRNFPETLRYGVTLAEYYRLTPNIILNGQVNYVRARFIKGPYSGKTIPAVPALNANGGINYEFKNNWQIKYIILYTGSRYASEDYMNIGKKQFAYWINTIALQYIYKSFATSFEVDNVFNRKYSTYALFNPTTHMNTYYPGVGRNYLLTIKINLD